MAITLIGGSATFAAAVDADWLNSAASDGTSVPHIPVTVPADAEIMLIGISGYGSANRLATNGAFNIGAANSVAASGGTGTGATSTGAWQCALHYILAPPTGAQNLEWQWGATLDDAANVLGYCFLKGIDTASPIRSSDGSNAGGDSESTGTLTAVAGDWIIAFGGTFDGGEGELTFTWSGGGSATSIGQGVHATHADGGMAAAQPTGNQAITWTATGADEGGIAAFVIKAGAAGAPDLTVAIQEPTISITTF